jgi:type I restriction enzyme M protein
MFLERYHDLLKPGGRLLTVIDDGVLGGRKLAFVRDYLRARFLINGIISLHGDAFRRAGARTKTSILCLTKRNEIDEGEALEDQPDAFVYESRYIGLDDVPSKTPPSVAAKARQEAAEEMDKIVAAYEAFLAGKKGPWLVKAARLGGRLDAKYLNPWSVEKLEAAWEKVGAQTARLGDIVDHIEEQVSIHPTKTYTFLRISYAGYATGGEKRLGSEISYDWIGRAESEDIVVSNINAVNGATCVLPEKAKGHLITSEYTVLRVKKQTDVDPMYLWSVLRSPAVIAEWLSSSTGLGRHRVTWDLLKDQKVPLLPKAKRDQVAALNRKEYRLFEEMMATRESATDELAPLDLYGEIAKDKLARAKPPR